MYPNCGASVPYRCFAGPAGTHSSETGALKGPLSAYYLGAWGARHTIPEYHLIETMRPSIEVHWGVLVENSTLGILK